MLNGGVLQESLEGEEKVKKTPTICLLGSGTHLSILGDEHLLCLWQLDWLSLGCPVQPPLVYWQGGMRLFKGICICTRHIIYRALLYLVLLLVSVWFQSLQDEAAPLQLCISPSYLTLHKFANSICRELRTIKPYKHLGWKRPLRI